MKITVLPFLSAQHIQSMFVRIEPLVPPRRNLGELITYVCQPWIEHPMFGPHCWSVYNSTVRFSHYRSEFFVVFLHVSVYFITPTVCTIYILLLSSDRWGIPLDIIFYFIVESLNYANIMSEINYLFIIYY